MTTTTKTSKREISSGVRSNPAWRWFYYAAMVVFAALFLFPLVYMVSSSFKPDDQVLANSQSLEAFLPIPFVGLENYADAIDRAQFPRVFMNSVIITSFIVGLGLIVNSLFGYALARLRFRGRKFVLAVVIALIIIPFEALAIPLLYMAAEVGWLDTYQIQILPFIAWPLFIFLFYTFFLGIPKSLEEAARARGLTVERTDWLRRREDGFIPGLGASLPVQDTAFTLPAETSSPRIFEVDGKLTLIQSLERREPDAEALAAQADVERTQLLERERGQLLDAWVDAERRRLETAGQLWVNLAALEEF